LHGGGSKTRRSREGFPNGVQQQNPGGGLEANPSEVDPSIKKFTVTEVY